jgi:hypothetical protein
MYPVAHVPISPLNTPIIPNTFSDIRATKSLNLADNMLCGINKHGSGTYDASGKPLALLVQQLQQ